MSERNNLRGGKVCSDSQFQRRSPSLIVSGRESMAVGVGVEQTAHLMEHGKERRGRRRRRKGGRDRGREGGIGEEGLEGGREGPRTKLALQGYNHSDLLSLSLW